MLEEITSRIYPGVSKCIARCKADVSNLIIKKFEASARAGDGIMLYQQSKKVYDC
jgi:hypothetical protein